MQGVIKGENITVSFFKDSSYQLFSCFRNVQINFKSDFIGKSTIGSGNWKEKEVVALDWSVNFEGAMYLNQSGFVNAQDMIDFWIGMVPVSVVIDMHDDESNVISYSGDVLIVNVNPNGTVFQAGALSVAAEGTGELSTYS